MSVKLFVLLLSVVASVSALHTPRNIAHHRALAHRAPPRRRCKPRSSAIVPSSSPVPVANVAPAVPTTSNKPAPTTTSNKPPPTTTSNKPEPTTTTFNKPPPTTAPPKPSSTPRPDPPATTKPSSGGGGFMTGIQFGQGTFYDTGLGACGIVNKDTDYIAAVSHLLFDIYPNYNGVNPNTNPLCGRKVKATYKGKSVTVAITDRCEGCAIGDLDFSPSAFNDLADFGLGRIDLQWVWA